MSYHRVPLSDELVGIVMAKLTLTYGKRFTHGYDASPETVRAHWAHELAGVSEQGIRYALDRLPPDYVPNCLQVRMLATQRPQNDYKALPAPQASPEVKQRGLQALAGLREAFTKRQPTLAWAERILANPAGKSLYTLRMATQVLRDKGRIE